MIDTNRPSLKPVSDLLLDGFSSLRSRGRFRRQACRTGTLGALCWMPVLYAAASLCLCLNRVTSRLSGARQNSLRW